MTLRKNPIDEDSDGILDSCAMGLISTPGVLSFHDARPRGASDIDFGGDDQWVLADMKRVS